MLSYAMAMLILFAFSLLFLTAHGIVGGRASYLDGGIALAMISGGAFILSRPAIRLKGWLNTMQQVTERLLGRTWSTQWTERLIDELDRARALLASRRRDVLFLVLIQLTALCGHSMGMLLVLRAFDVQTNLSSLQLLAAHPAGGSGLPLAHPYAGSTQSRIAPEVVG